MSALPLPNILSKVNSTIVPLAADASFTGLAENVLSFQEIDVSIAYAPEECYGTFYFEFSPDGTHWDVSLPIICSGPEMPPQTLRIVLPYFRVRFVNGNTPHTELRITTIYHREASTRLTRFLNQPLTNTEPIIVTRSAINAKLPDGTYDHAHLGQEPMATSLAVTIASNQSPVPVSASALPLPAGAGTEATLATRLADATFTTRINTLGQKSMSNSTPVVLASNQSPIDVVVVSGAGGSNLKMAYDIGETVIYIGEAELGSATNASVWTIKRITLVNGEPTFTEWSDGTAIWDDRVTESYT